MPTSPGFPCGQAHLSLQGFRNIEAANRKVKQINNVELLDLELSERIILKSIFKGFGLFFLSEERAREMGRNPDLPDVQASSPNCVGQREHVSY